MALETSRTQGKSAPSQSLPPANPEASSHSPAAAMDKDSLAQTLDQIHTSASKSETLTTFDELTRPSSSSSTKDGIITASQTTQVKDNLYNRIRNSVAGSREASSNNAAKPKTDTRTGSPEKVARDPPSSKKASESSKSVEAFATQVHKKDQRSIGSTDDASKINSPHSSRSLKSPTSAPSTSDMLPLVESPQVGDLRDFPETGDQPRRPSLSIVKAPSRDPAGSSIPIKSVSSSTAAVQDPQTTHSNSSNPQPPIALPPTSGSEVDEEIDRALQRNHLRLPRGESPTPSSRSMKSFTSSLQLPGYSLPSAAGTQESRSRTEKGDLIVPHRRDSISSETQSQQGPAPNSLIYQMQRKILSRDFWMKDENAKFCFNCGESFTTFRRKHHCRLCGQIYCNSCTRLISGKPFGQASKLRVCRTCEGMLIEDDSSDYSDDDESTAPAVISKQIRFSEAPVRTSSPNRAVRDKKQEVSKWPSAAATTSSTRRPKELRRTFTGSSGELIRQSPLSRPPSSRSLKSLGSRPRSSSYKSHPSRHQHMRSLSFMSGEGAPFHRNVAGQDRSDQHLPAFHTDSIIDPDLAPFMSDEDSSDDGIGNISTTLAADTNDQNALGFNGILGALRRGGRPRTPAHKPPVDTSPTLHEAEIASVTNSRTGQTRRQLGARTLSASSLNNYSLSPHIIRSNNLLKNPDAFHAMLGTQKPLLRNESSPTLGQTNSIADDKDSNKSHAAMADLNPASLEHVKRLLHQFLTDLNIEHAQKWERALLPILLQCAEQVDPSIHRGDDIDIRHYIKLKKAPGGAMKDSKYISGIVFTNNVALRDMPRSIKNPKILLVSFPLVYVRHQEHFMSLEGVIAQELEYLRNLSKRIIALHPDLLLANGQVAGLLIGFLRDGGVTVVQNVKSSVLLAASRFSETKVVTSVDKLTMDPANLGRCGQFSVKTYVYNNSRKSHVYLSGCHQDLGCTIVLRGADRKTLAKMKWITEFMCYVVYNLKLETCLLRDQFVSLPSSTDSNDSANAGGQYFLSTSNDSNKPGEQTSIGPYDRTVKELRKRLLSASPFVKLPEPYLLRRGQEQELKMLHLRNLQQEEAGAETASAEQINSQKFELVRPDMVYAVTKNTPPHVRDILQAVHKSEYEKAEHNYTSIQRRWEMYINGVVEPYSPLTHQKLVALFSIVSMPSQDACVGPDLLGLDFYQEHDIEEGCERDMPLGEYVERLCDQVDLPCMAGHCEEKMIDHQRNYVHGEGQISASIQKMPSRYRGMENTILMWSSCRICDQETQIAPMSASSWKYSFAKYLELSFWCNSLHPRAGTCSHSIQRDHIRYFGFKNLAVRIQYDSINLVEIRVPRSLVTWAVDKDLRLKNEQYQKIEERVSRFMSSVKLRLKKIKLDPIDSEKHEAGKSEVESLSKLALEQHETLITQLQQKYMSSKFYEIVPLNQAFRNLQEKVAEWDTTFADFERNYFPSEKDLRKLAAIQLRKAFMDKDSALPINIEEDGTSAEKPESDIKMPTSDRVSESVSGDEVSLANSDLAKDEITSVHPTYELDPARTQVIQSLDLAVPSDDISGPLHAAHDIRTESSSSCLPIGNESGDRTTSDSQLEPNRDSGLEKINATLADTNMVAKTDAELTPSKISRPASPAQARRGKGNFMSPPLPRSRTQPAVPTLSRPSSPSFQESPGVKKISRVEAALLTPTQGTSKIPLANLSKLAEQKSPGGHISSAARIGKTTMQSMIPRSTAVRKLESKVSALAKHFEELSREFEKERLREKRQRAASTRQSRALPVASVKPIVEVFKDANEAVRERENPYEEQDNKESRDSSLNQQSQEVQRYDEVDRSESAGQDESASQSPQRNVVTDHSEENTVVASYPPSEFEGVLSESETIGPADGIASGDVADRPDNESVESHDQALEIGKAEKTSLMKMLTSFWSERSASGWVPLEYPLAVTDHIFADSDLIVREDEPSSLISFALDSNDYKGKIQKFWERANVAAITPTSPLGEADTGSADVDVERIMLGKTATHMRYQFQSGSARMQCKIFYAESFDAIRRKCGVSDRFVESLSRCLKWDSKGGKTRSLFLKTLDERFVLKSLSAVETQAFLKFAPDYFDYMSKCLFHSLPSALAKMLGFYQVVIKNSVTGTEFNMFLQVMENVFYEGPSNRMFDLKGSMRNRKVQSTGQKDEVLLDENLLDYISQSPMYIRNHSNTILASSIQNDTLFCSKQNVMDYSLIVGLYDDRKELLVGIIDYIRTYTWDKKLESWIKDRGKHKATVRSPKEYRTRFRRSIPRYFPLAPSCWQVFGMQRIEEVRARLETGTSDSEGDESEDGEAVVENNDLMT